MEQRVNIITLGVGRTRLAGDGGVTAQEGWGGFTFGYSGVCTDPDGHTWEVAYISGLGLREDGTAA